MSSSAPVTQSLASQVGGHPGVLTTEDGSLLIKPALHRELDFYQALQTETNQALAKLRKHTPKFLGTLRLEGQAEPTGDGGELEIKPIAAQKDKCRSFKDEWEWPNILDVKLGTVLYDETASEDKVKRMIRVARETTSWETGVRLTGFQVYDNHTAQPVNTPKSYGKSIKPSDLPDGIARFFPAYHPSSETPSDETAPTLEPRHGLPPATLLPIVTSIRSEIAQIRETLAELDMRMVGGSLLIIYEAEWDRAHTALQKHLSSVAKEGAAEGEGVADDEEGEYESSDEEDEEEVHPPPFMVKLIDFAHTRIEPGLGPDQGVLLGVDTVLSLLDGRIEEVKAKFGL